MAQLFMIAPAPVIELARGRLRLDVKFVEGMQMHVEKWDGPVTCVLKRGAQSIPFGAEYDPADFGFDLRLIDADALPSAEGTRAGDVIFAGADMFDVLHLAEPDQRPAGVKLVYSVEYDLETRLRIAALDRSRGGIGKLKSTIWLLNQERRRRRALRACDGIQANGYPALAAYGSMTDHGLLYLDGRMSAEMMCTPKEQSNRIARLRSGAPLRLIHSGRLEPMKGGQDLIPVAQELAAAGTAFTLDIFGAGSLRQEIAAAIASAGLGTQVRLHDPVDFATELVPFSRTQADLFLSCHRQSDPSCTYLESMGCGVPVIGYRNGMWGRMAQETGAGWALPIGQTKALAARISQLARTPEEVISASETGLKFAKAHDFQTEFSKRMDHLAQVAAF